MLQVRMHVMLTSIFITLEIILYSNPGSCFKPTKSFVNCDANRTNYKTQNRMQGYCQIKLEINLILSSIVQAHHIHGVNLHGDYSSQTWTPSFPEHTSNSSINKATLTKSKTVEPRATEKRGNTWQTSPWLHWFTFRMKKLQKFHIGVNRCSLNLRISSS